MALRQESGDRAGALQTYRDFSKRLREDLEVEPMTETASLRSAHWPSPGGNRGTSERGLRGRPLPRTVLLRIFLEDAGRNARCRETCRGPLPRTR
jgi:DNA-binding SARP family transcriptional activator